MESVAIVEALAELARCRRVERFEALVEAFAAQWPAAACRYEPLLSELRARVSHFEELQRLAGRDALTGIANRRIFEETLQRELARVRRHGGSVGVVLLDLDELKPINDRFGHAAGDEAIVTVARCCAATVRAGDLVARLGGDEFAVVLPETDALGARMAALRLRLAVERESICKRPLRVSVGSASSDGALDAETLVRRADEDLYQDKTSRRGGERRRVAVG